ncbi:uncharacterized protein OCT59_004430 [Rhizophagus irregularis]|uniref:Uncharacterized protein n=2 Tax=Rhizophagus irregularis TaxID=588596 RepID=A0A015MY90_RHIIW|nr:hypothetical protein GLOIN_2v1772043 [Rhizophagus irregularis DAOM 181602=DAOM 197198]EXX71768.1 hypothetical protein RirG_075370 [Rhizophagus irregularis DAOM 197198w]POG73868.1 hypothetical protein GLOIN_2v1772043 [Rhizophagus irregularis DAOM 181602=DAOM 197198]UZO12922.1 hypothetical protein OCT59_004430 [Rhizophagus irregularis]|eukprot:XP_025180734.1 hypothetical protein GLOIN_2v1772043 [Rhizophagus irregularis DAOM 181602=DAOM 197198]
MVEEIGNNHTISKEKMTEKKDIIIPKKPYIFTHSNFKDKQYVITSPEICKALYDHYEKNTKDIIVNVIKNFAKIAGSPLASKLVEMMAHDILQKGGTYKVRRLIKDSNEGSEKLPVQELTLKELKHKQFREIDEISSGQCCEVILNDTNDISDMSRIIMSFQ